MTPLPKTAFPYSGVGDDLNYSKGMTLRDYFAAMVLMGSATVTDADLGTVDDIANTCYKLADAMLKARQK